MTILIILANVGVFLAMGASTGHFDWSGRELLNWGGNLGELSLRHQWWRLLTATYLHANFQHILGNMVLLAIVGSYVEARIGSIRFFLAYTACGVAASALSALGHLNSVGVGASGAVAGVVGIMVVFYWSDRFPEITGRWIAQTVGINALYSLAPNVDALAHLGGFIAGLALGGVLLALAPRAAIDS